MSSRQIHQEVPLGYGSYDPFGSHTSSRFRGGMPPPPGCMPPPPPVSGMPMGGVLKGCAPRGGASMRGPRLPGGMGNPMISEMLIGSRLDAVRSGIALPTSRQTPLHSISPIMTKSSTVMDYSSSEDSDSDSDDGWSSNPRTKSSKATPASTDGKSTSLPQKEMSKNDSLTNLIHLQLANGCFKFGQALENLIGMTEQELMEKCFKGEDSITWITAVAFATLEKFFSNDKDLWDLVAKKAKLFIQKHAKDNFDEIIKNAKTLI